MTDVTKNEENKAAVETATVEAKTAEAPVQVAEASVQELTVAPTASTAVAQVEEQSFEDMMAEDAGAGAEFIGMNERTIPFLTILQNGSPEVQKGGPEQIKGAESSDFMNTLTKQIYQGNVAEVSDKPGEGKGRGLLVLPVQFKVKDIEWIRRDDKGGGGGLVQIWGDDQSYKTNGQFVFDAKRNRWANPEKNSEVSAHYETYGIVVGSFDKDDNLIQEPMPAVISMKGSQVKKSKAWNSQLIMRRMMVKGKSLSAPLWYDAWRLMSKFEQNDQGSWFGYVISLYEPEGMPAPVNGQPKAGSTLYLPGGKDLYMMCREMSQDLKSGILVVDDTHAAVGEGTGGVAFSDAEVPF